MLWVIVILVGVGVLSFYGNLFSLGFKPQLTYDDFILGKPNANLWKSEFKSGYEYVKNERGIIIRADLPWIMESIKDFSGNDVSFGYMITTTGQSIDGRGVCDVSCCCSYYDVTFHFGQCRVTTKTTPSTYRIQGFLEMESSRLTDEYIVKHNGAVVCTGRSLNKSVPVRIVVGNGGGNTGELLLTPILYEIPFETCKVGSGELLVGETFRGSDLFSTRYPVKRFCRQHDVIIYDEIKGGTDTSEEPYEWLLKGQVVIVPEHQVWQVFYVTKNVDNAGNKIIPTDCDYDSEYVDLESGKCTGQAGIVQLCGVGSVYDVSRKACISTTDPICERGVYDTGTGECVILVPNLEHICESGTLDVESGECKSPEPLSEFECDFGYERRDISVTETSCVRVVSETTETVLVPVNAAMNALELSREGTIIVILILLGFTAVASVYWGRKK